MSSVPVFKYRLDLEEARDDTRSVFRPAGATFLDVLGVVGGDDILARLRVVHDGRGVREESVEDPVEDSGRDEGVDVADGEPVNPVNVSLLPKSSSQTMLACLWGSLRRGTRREEAYRCWPPSEMLVVPSPATTMLLTKPGRGGMQPIKKATNARQLVPHR